jgi:hypothetical protein
VTLGTGVVRTGAYVVTHPREAAGRVVDAATYAIENPGDVAAATVDMGRAVAGAAVDAGREVVRVVREGTPEERGRLAGAVVFEIATSVGTGGAAPAARVARAGTLVRRADRAADGARAVDRASDVARAGDRVSEASRSAGRADDGLLAAARRREETCVGGACRTPGNCFGAGTLVTSEDGLVAIETVAPGDRVLARDEASGELGWFPVVQTFAREAPITLTLTYVTAERLESLVVTAEHPFHTPYGWREAGELQVGERIDLAGGGHAEVLAWTRSEQPTLVFNFEVETAHTYFVGEDQLWTHNTCGSPGPLRGRAAVEAAVALGFQKTNFRSHNQPVFRRGNRYITPDVDQHNGGVWKMADSVEALGRKSTRLGTYDAQLNRIGD